MSRLYNNIIVLHWFAMFCVYEMIKCDTVLNYVDAIKGPTVCDPDPDLTLYRQVQANHRKNNMKWLL